MSHNPSETQFDRWYDGVLGLLAVVMIVAPKLVALPFAGLLAVTIIGLVRKKMTFAFNSMAFCFVLLYAVYGIYCLWTNHPTEAGKYMEYKLSFVLLPLFFSFRPGTTRLHYTISGFLLAVTGLLLYSVINGFSCLVRSHDIHCFLSSVFSNLHHPTYFSAYLVVAIGMVVHGYRNRWKYYSLWGVVALVAFFSVGIILCLSLSGILFFFGFLSFAVLYTVFRKWGRAAGMVATALAPVTIWLSIVSIPYVEGEWTTARFYAEEYLKDPGGFVKGRSYPMTGTEVRIAMWTAATAEGMEHPMGVGTANADDHLTDRLTAWGQPELAANRYNPHNQYLQTWLETGIIGLLLLTLIIGYGIVYGIRNHNWLLVLVAANMGFNCLFESMLQRQSGIVFYVFWMVLLVVLSDRSSEPQER